MNKNIQELEIGKYEYYAVVPFPDVNKIEFTVSGGLVECTEVDFYNIGDKTLLAFIEDDPFFGYHNFLASSAVESEVMQVSYYHYLKDIINLRSEYPTTIFSFNDSKAIQQVNPDLNSVPLINSVNGELVFRCDVDKMGPFPFYPRVGSYRIKNAKIFLSLTGVGHLIFLESPDENVYFPQARGVNTIAQTIAGAITNIYEWKQAAESPFNSVEDISVKAKQFIDQLGLENIAAEISSEQVPMKVARYLNGSTTTDFYINEVNFMTDNLKNYLLAHTMYTTLNSIVSNYPGNVEIPESKLNEEKNYLEEKIYQYCVEEGIDPLEATIEDIFKHIQTNINYSESTTADYPRNPIFRSIVKTYFA